MSAKIVLFLLIFFNLILFLNFKTVSRAINIYDYPDKIRKFQKKPIPILGGLFLYFSLLIIFFSNYFFNEDHLHLIGFDNKAFLFFFFISSLIFFLYFFDVLKNLNLDLKLFLLILIIFIYISIDSDLIITELRFKFLEQNIILKYFTVPFTLLSFLLFINAFNMFDGINLQCGIYSIFIFILLFVLTHNLAILYFIVPVLFFLILNYKNNCFLGNNGSSLLSFILAVLVIKIYNYNKIIFADDIFLLMCIPGFDLLRLAFIRLINKRHPFYPDRNHLHHLLLPNHGVNLTILIIQFAIIFPNILNYFTNISSLLLIIFSLIIYIFLIFTKKTG